MGEAWGSLNFILRVHADFHCFRVCGQTSSYVQTRDSNPAKIHKIPLQIDRHAEQCQHEVSLSTPLSLTPLTGELGMRLWIRVISLHQHPTQGVVKVEGLST